VAVLVVGIAVVVVAVVVAVLLTRTRRSDDGVEGFRRQIDALSSDARRPTIDRGLGDDDEPAAGHTDPGPADGGDDPVGGADTAGGSDDGA
jgi:hypothetical protein